VPRMNDYWKKNFGWSKSRQKTWDTCKLGYYYAYIGKWEGWKGDPNREKLQWLNKKTNWHFVPGELVHKAIASQINQHAIGRPISKEAAKNLLRSELKKIQVAPRDYLIEEINGFPVQSSDYQKSEKDGLELLDSFFDIIWPNYDSYDYIKHEDYDRFLIDDVKVWVKVDLVTKTKANVVIVTDWKTGKPREREEEDRSQVLGYILWAMNAFNQDETKVRAELRYLRDAGGAPTVVDATKDELDEFSQRIVGSARAMLAVTSESDFPPTPAERECRGCAFATICQTGMVHIPKQAQGTPIQPGAIAKGRDSPHVKA